jgi:uncharacterized membrane protein
MMIADLLKGKWLGHPLHPILVHMPMALWPAALVFDLLSLAGIGGNIMVRTSLLAIGVGLAVALLAVPTGIVDWSGIKPAKPAWKIGLWHMVLNAVVLILFAINFVLRLGTYRAASSISGAPLALSIVGTLVLFVSAYLGGRMVYAYGINVARLSKSKWRKIAESAGANVAPEK